jgi:hypothetical protein
LFIDLAGDSDNEMKGYRKIRRVNLHGPDPIDHGTGRICSLLVNFVYCRLIDKGFVPIIANIILIFFCWRRFWTSIRLHTIHHPSIQTNRAI